MVFVKKQYKVKIRSPWYDDKGRWFEVWVSTTFIPIYKPLKSYIELSNFTPIVSNLSFDSIDEAESFIELNIPNIESYRKYINKSRRKYRAALNRFRSKFKPKVNKRII